MLAVQRRRYRGKASSDTKGQLWSSLRLSIAASLGVESECEERKDSKCNKWVDRGASGARASCPHASSIPKSVEQLDRASGIERRRRQTAQSSPFPIPLFFFFPASLAGRTRGISLGFEYKQACVEVALQRREERSGASLEQLLQGRKRPCDLALALRVRAKMGGGGVGAFLVCEVERVIKQARRCKTRDAKALTVRALQFLVLDVSRAANDLDVRETATVNEEGLY
ncbi:hypothetical protein MTO96_023816 [Rhipicephalus appendiculatus]